MPSLVAPTIPAGFVAGQPQPSFALGNGVILRAWVRDDAPSVMAAYQDPQIQRWHVRRTDSLVEAEQWIESWRNGWAAETGAQWAVVDSDAGDLLGRVALKALDLEDGTAEIAYWMVPEARGRGVCPRAVESVVSWAFDSTGFERLELQHAVGNAASCRVAEKTRFELEGVRRSAWAQTDGRHDAHVHARLRSESLAEGGLPDPKIKLRT